MTQGSDLDSVIETILVDAYGDDEQLVEMPDDAIGPEESAERAALR